MKGEGSERVILDHFCLVVFSENRIKNVRTNIMRFCRTDAWKVLEPYPTNSFPNPCNPYLFYRTNTHMKRVTVFITMQIKSYHTPSFFNKGITMIP